MVTNGPSSYRLRHGYQVNINETLIEFYNRRFPEDLRTKIELLPGSTGALFITDDSKNLYIDFKRTLRVPEDGKVYQLPPPLENFPLLSAKSFDEHLPPMMKAKDGLIFPMLQREALLISFSSGNRAPNQFAVRVYAGSINALTGCQAEQDRSEEQDYVVAPAQYCLSGFCSKPGQAKQFVAMPMGQGYTVEKQIAGLEYIGGIQLEIIPRYFESVNFGKVSLNTGDQIQHTDFENGGMDHFLSPKQLGFNVGDRLFMRDCNPRNLYDYNINVALPILSPHNKQEDRFRPTFVSELFNGARCTNYDLSSSLLVTPIMAIRLIIVFEANLEGFELQCSPLATFDAVKKEIQRRLFEWDVRSLRVSGSTKDLDEPGAMEATLEELQIQDGAEVVPQIQFTGGRYGAGQGGRTPRPVVRGDIPGWDMGLAAGGNTRQEICQDEDPRIWNWRAAKTVNIQILNSVSFHAITGIYPPASPVSFKHYKAAGIPLQALAQSLHPGAKQESLGGIKSVGELDGETDVRLDVALTRSAVVGCICCETSICDSM
jgi:hypothetical protein